MGEKPDCLTCEDRCPDLLPENQEAWELWQLSYTQWRGAGFSIIGLDYPAVFQIAEILEIEVNDVMLAKLKSLEMYDLERFRKDAKKGDGR